MVARAYSSHYSFKLPHILISSIKNRLLAANILFESRIHSGCKTTSQYSRFTFLFPEICSTTTINTSSFSRSSFFTFTNRPYITSTSYYSSLKYWHGVVLLRKTPSSRPHSILFLFLIILFKKRMKTSSLITIKSLTASSKPTFNSSSPPKLYFLRKSSKNPLLITHSSWFVGSVSCWRGFASLFHHFFLYISHF